jgi:hypothetical protein
VGAFKLFSDTASVLPFEGKHTVNGSYKNDLAE